MDLPATLGKYELLEFLGGGMSHVYRGHDTVIDRPVVVKILTQDSCGNAEAKARFLQEARLAGNIQHENIVSVFDYGEHEGRPFIVMEYLKGEDLRHAIRDGHLQGLEQRVKISADLAAALEFVHARGIVHRDIKPENIHLDANGKVKLMDFGIAKTADLTLTKTGMAMGTPYYMAPEQIAGKPNTPLVDIYAYGLVLFELFTGMRSVTGETMESVFYQILNVPLDVTALENAGVPQPIRDLILRCTRKKPEERCQSFRQVVEELRTIQSPTGAFQTQAVPSPATIAPKDPVAPQRSQAQSKRPWIQLAAFLMFSMAAVAWFMNRGAPAVPGMMYFPAGKFIAGADNKPAEVGAFYLDDAETTNNEYCRVMGCQVKDSTGELPVVNIVAAQAREYAMRVGKRLPTALEWERATRGANGLMFPWGDQLDASKTNTADNPNSGRALMPARSLAAVPPFHIIGNAWEMVEGRVSPSAAAVDQFATLLVPPPSAQEPWIAIRGGSYNETLSPNLSYDAGSIPERFSSPLIGFRCAKSP